ncbi:LytTR family DNA-binding domain-containing protein [Psychroserpens sp. SPM9]|uniref:LytTR family DNA-binding domain-containing protein n=1 Tax=Psychroserpens sp. SPM9 TaxID=2975598 RepID=UPI0021A63F5C|nr:LytTR family DNA-binding domain-containing protein [Psychroserpens sp. SPM9]MDG5491080.1 LytTR family DNA-binding domain-containing protein [Psychroserpens sp. SPM9]
MRLNQLLEQPFLYFNTAKRKWVYIISATLFVHVFLIIFQPYGISEEMENPVNEASSKFLFFFSIGISTLLGLTLSQFVLRPLLKFENVSIKKYCAWVFVETLILSLINFGFSFVIPDLGNDFENELNFAFQLKNYFRAFVILLFPLFGTIIYVLIQELTFEVNELGEQIKKYHKAFDTSRTNTELKLKDENNNLDLSIALKDFLYAESSNQYIVVHYIKSGTLKKHILRNRLKNFLNQNKYMSIKQSHRSFAVNLLNVKHLSRINGKEFLIIATNPAINIPVSKSYIKEIKNEITQHYKL